MGSKSTAIWKFSASIRTIRGELTTVALLVLSSGASTAQDVFTAVPGSLVTASNDSSTHEVLGEVEALERIVVIRMDGDRFLWASREGTELLYRQSGAFHIFIAENGAGYIKIFDSSFLGDLAEPGQPRFLYMEHIHSWLTTITYFGGSDVLHLPWVR